MAAASSAHAHPGREEFPVTLDQQYSARVSAGKQRALIGGILLLAALLRLGHLWSMSDDLFFRAPVIDARLNADEATYLANVSWAGPDKPYWKPPGYSYVLAAEFSLFGPNAWVPRLFQILLDLGTCLLAFAIARRLFSSRVAWATLAATAACGPLIYFSAELVSASLAVFMVTLLVYVVARLRASESLLWWHWLGAGALLGLAALVRAELLLLVFVVPPWIWLRDRSARPGRRRAIAAVAFVVGAVLAVAPVTIRNATVGGDAVLISANGGINFYIGTNPQYRGMVGLRPGTEWERLVHEPDSEGVTEVGSAHSAYFVRKAIRTIGDAPGRNAAHAGKKLVLFWHGHELASNADLYRTRAASPVMRALVWRAPGLYFPFGVIGPLCLIGIAIAVRRRHVARPLIAVVGLLVVVAVAFFVTARFRAPLLPIAIMFAAFAVETIAAELRRNRSRALVLFGAAVLPLWIVANGDWVFAADRAYYARQVTAEVHHYRGSVLMDSYGRYSEAREELRAAIALEPTRASSHFNLGQAAARQGDAPAVVDAMKQVVHLSEAQVGERYLVGDAIAFIADAVRASPEVQATDFGRGIGCQGAGDWDCAISAFRAADDPVFSGMALLSRGELALRSGDTTAALDDLNAAKSLRPGDARTRLLLAVGHDRSGDAARSRAELEQFRRLEWPRGALARALALRELAPASFDAEVKDLLDRSPD